MKIKELPPQETLLDLFIYDHAVGELRRKKRRPGVKPGLEAGSIHYDKRVTPSVPRIRVHIYGEAHFVSRVVWKMVTGKDPADQIDHINGNSLDDRFCNLREATSGQNQLNKKTPRNNLLGIKGVARVGKKYLARMWVNNNLRRIGVYKTKEEAEAARKAAEKERAGSFYRE